MEENREFARKLEQRTLSFAVRIIRLSSQLPKTAEGQVVRNQLTKSGTSVGANYRESNRARSRADFKNKIRICEGEAAETQYWLEILMQMKWLPKDRVQGEYDECSELLALFSSIAKNIK